MSTTSIGTGETGPDTDSHIIFLARALKAPVIREHFSRIADQAREQSWTHEQYLAAVLDRQVSAREASGTATRIAAALPSNQTVEEFNFDYQPSARRDVIANLATTSFITAGVNVVLLGPPGTGETHLATGRGIKAA